MSNEYTEEQLRADPGLLMDVVEGLTREQLIELPICMELCQADAVSAVLETFRQTSQDNLATYNVTAATTMGPVLVADVENDESEVTVLMTVGGRLVAPTVPGLEQSPHYERIRDQIYAMMAIEIYSGETH